MSKEPKHIFNLILAAIGLAMGVAVIVITIVDADISTNEIIRLLAISSVCFGILWLNKISKSE